MNQEPLPCPFCGEKPVVFEHNDWKRAIFGDQTFSVMCQNKACGVNPQSCYDQREHAIEEWNKRAPAATS